MKDARVLCERGFTLIELLIAIVISSVIVAGGYTVLTATNRATISNERAVGTQQNIRVAMELIARDIKQAGFGMPMAPDLPVGGTAGNCATGATGTTAAAIRPVDNNSAIPLTAVNDTGADTISLVVPRTNPTNGAIPGWVLASAAPSGGAGSFTTITLTATAVTEMVAEGMQNGSGAYVSLGGVRTLPVTSSSGATITLGTPTYAPLNFPAGTQVYLLQCVTYQVATGAANCGSAGPCLTRTVDSGTAPTITTSLVDGVEDLQFAYGCDGCNTTIKAGVPDGVIDDFNGNNTFDIADFQTNRVWSFGTFDPATIRLAQINVVARQTAVDQGTGEGIQAGSLSTPIQVSDHLPSNDAGYAAATYQSFRRRFLTRTVDT
ncbi:MAG: prepilin-type N-terminal cleavage/methylation domain-containing protein, partial [Nitrospirales bacterium]